MKRFNTQGLNDDDPPPVLRRRQGTSGTWLVEEETPKLIAQFLDGYYRAHFFTLADKAQALIEAELEDLTDSSGQEVQAKVTSRTKTKKSLEEKLKMRNKEEPYESIESIWKDIHDLAGVRIILYTPTERQHKKVGEMIRSIWKNNVQLILHDGSGESSTINGFSSEPEQNLVSTTDAHHNERRKAYRRRHRGYQALHYRVTMTEKHQSGTKTKPSYEWSKHDRVEIQVVSALVHAWAEVGHDVLYKTYAYGPPDTQEERILDSLSGLVSTGDILLEQFGELVNKRTRAKILHLYDFGTFLRGLDILQSPKEQQEGSYADFGPEGTNILFRYLVNSNQNVPLIVRRALKDIGYPKAPRLRDILVSFEPMLEPPQKLLAPLCLIRHMLLEEEEKNKQQEDQQQGERTPQKQIMLKEYRLSQQCSIMVEALTLLQVFAGGPEEAKAFLEEDINLDKTEIKSLNFVLSNFRRTSCMTEDTDDIQKKIGFQLQPAWDWFQEQVTDQQSMCGFCFQLAEMDVIKNVIEEATKEADVRARLRALNIGALSRN
ncbi:hypothetical protein P153DRAFT_358621 [Dothidotthia symphoricarpi CBS 119687]|uniref:RelA/SpoT domain-containing protein n=1 Tax=Dothidotthia symphoricarpi CBS 119687 TaxID=1392245 RepID=A0A6A6A6Y9_9PLEO|nr:uncharacterized protein P153DRAFT_358621 [Dothidotthia symphoricarpi CBS 119687]KAF2127782.1 hypothetical protein P153DRAFT_358621 [Dothidotthia symphoricarpi CBS 119687]